MTSTGKRVHYSKQTKTIVQDIMKSVNLPHRQRNIILNHLDRGTPINLDQMARTYRPGPLITVSYASKRAKKRPKTAMLRCGAYDVDRFIPTRAAADREKEIEKLQNIFSGMDELDEDDVRSEPPSAPSVDHFSESQRVRELMQAVHERVEFLKHMEELGHRRKYEFDITLEISEKLRLLENLSKQ